MAHACYGSHDMYYYQCIGQWYIKGEFIKVDVQLPKVIPLPKYFLSDEQIDVQYAPIFDWIQLYL